MDSIDVTVRVYDPDEPSRLVDPIDPDSLIEMRDPSGAYLPTRSAMTRVDEGTYTTRFDLFHEGTWQLIALPDVSDRTLLPARSTPQVTLEVQSETSPGEDSINRAGTIAFLALIAGGVIIAMLAGPWLRRPKGQPKAEPTGHDTWWASP